jgi:D-alanyl-D-alanine carboxypeptidase
MGRKAEKIIRALLASTLAVSLSLLSAPAADAKARKRVNLTHKTVYSELAGTPKYTSIVIEADTGAVLSSVDPDLQTYPASLTKMMTLYLAFQRLAQHKISLDMTLPVSAYATTMAPSKLELREGQTIRVEDAILALCTKSANDVAVVLAEGLSGTEEAFAEQMTATAHRLGMTRTHFSNASGLPNPEQKTTARDMATLGLALIHDFPQYYPYFNTRSFAYKGEVIGNHNHLLGVVDGVDGIKTGFIRASGFNLVASAKRDGHRVVAAVFGGSSPGWRDRQMAHLLDEGFDAIDERSEQQLVANAETPHSKHAQPVSYRSALPMSAMSVPVDQLLAQGDDEEAAPVKPSGKATAQAKSARSVQVASNDVMSAAPAKSGWAIQVGAFSTQKAAQAAATKATEKAAALKGGQIQVSQASAQAPFRARVGGLNQKRASDACKALKKQGMTCVTIAGDA